MRQSIPAYVLRFVLVGLTMSMIGTPALAEGLQPGQVIELSFPEEDLPPSLYSLFTGAEAAPVLKLRLPDNYDPQRPFPLLVYVPGYHGGVGGNLRNAQKIAGPRDWVVASLPLFKTSIDREEIGEGILVGFSDYEAISRAYSIMLGKLFETVPKIDVEQSAMVGFSNGAQTLAVLISSYHEMVLSHFKNFCLIDNGMFHLTDLHKKLSRHSRYLILSGDDASDFGRDLKIRAGKLLEDSWQLLGVDLTFYLMTETGHEFGERQMTTVGRWLRQEDFVAGEVKKAAADGKVPFFELDLPLQPLRQKSEPNPDLPPR